MPWAVRPKLLRQHLPFHPDISDLAKLGEAVSKYGLGLTFDTSHAFTPAPSAEDWFESSYLLIRNIHLSSFTEGKDHLPLNIGNLDTEGFVAELRKRRYENLITLEINYPRMIIVRSYDYQAIAYSVDAVKNNPSKV